MKDFGRFLGVAALASLALGCEMPPNAPKIAPEPLPMAPAMPPNRYPQKEDLPRVPFEQALQTALEGMSDLKDEQEIENWRELAVVWSKGFTLGQESEAANERIEALLKFLRISKNPFMYELYWITTEYRVWFSVLDGDIVFSDGFRDYPMMLAGENIMVSGRAILSGPEADPRLAMIDMADLIYNVRSSVNNPAMDDEVRAGASSAASLEAMLREMAMTGHFVFDGVGAVAIRAVLEPYLACGRANNECFRQAAGGPNVPLPQEPPGSLAPSDPRRL